MSDSARPYGGVSAEDRRSGRRARLIEAGLEVFGRRGWSGATVRSVCEQAGLTQRYFYESFANLEELLVAVFDEVAVEVLGAVIDIARDGPPDALDRARAAISAFLDLVSADPRKGRVLLLEAQPSEALQRRRLDTIRGFAVMIREQGSSFYGVDAPPHGLAELAATTLVGALAAAFLAWLEGEIEIDRDALVDYCAEIAVAAAEIILRRV